MMSMAQESSDVEGVIADDERAGVVETDLACAGCGYNLRTIAWAGICPECGLAVERSRLPADLRFESIKAMQRARTAVTLGAIAILPPIVANIGETILPWNLVAIRDELQSPLTPMAQAYTLYGHLVRWAYPAMYCLMAAALTLFVFSVVPRRRGLLWFILGTAILAAIGSFEDVSSFVGRYFRPITHEFDLAWDCANKSLLAAAIAPFWIILTLRLTRKHRLTQTMMWIALACFCLRGLLCLSALGVYLFADNRWIPLSPNLYQAPNRAGWEWFILNVNHFSNEIVETPVLLVVAVALWLYLRVLNGAVRKAEG